MSSQPEEGLTHKLGIPAQKCNHKIPNPVAAQLLTSQGLQKPQLFADFFPPSYLFREEKPQQNTDKPSALIHEIGDQETSLPLPSDIKHLESLCVCVCIYMHICIYIFVYPYINTHTHTHTHTHFLLPLLAPEP